MSHGARGPRAIRRETRGRFARRSKSAEQNDRAGHREGNADRGKEEAALRVWKTRWDADDAASGGEAE